MSWLDSVRNLVGRFGGTPLPEKVVLAEGGQVSPKPGYEWVTAQPCDFRVRWSPDKPWPEKHLLASMQEGIWLPAPGYSWVSPSIAGCLLVRWTPGMPHPRAPHVVASYLEGQWATEPGYRWQNQTAGDLRVVPAEGSEHHTDPLDSAISSGLQRMQRIGDLATLGLGLEACQQDIEASFRRLVKVHHPDHFHGHGPSAQEAAERSFRMLRGAYERLTGAGAQGGRS